MSKIKLLVTTSFIDSVGMNSGVKREAGQVIEVEENVVRMYSAFTTAYKEKPLILKDGFIESESASTTGEVKFEEPVVSAVAGDIGTAYSESEQSTTMNSDSIAEAVMSSDEDTTQKELYVSIDQGDGESHSVGSEVIYEVESPKVEVVTIDVVEEAEDVIEEAHEVSVVDPSITTEDSYPLEIDETTEISADNSEIIESEEASDTEVTQASTPSPKRRRR